MRNITVVGAGQSGLMVACGLVQKGYQVTLISNRTADEIQAGRVLSSQGMFWTAIQNERDLGLRFWEDQCPTWEGLQFNALAPTGERISSFAQLTSALGPVESLDQRVKMSGWMRQFYRWGGKLVIEEASIEDLERYCARSDLVLIASGKGEIGKLFERDQANSPYDQPMRILALTYVKGMQTIKPLRWMEPFRGLSWNGYPDVGEYFCTHTLTTTGVCDIMIFEGIPGGPMDCWDDVKTPEQHLAKSLWILDRFFPWEAERCRQVELTDDNGILVGRFAPIVRKPVGVLPSGALVMGIGDTVCLNDPLTGQGANNANKCGRVVHDAIVARADQSFDRRWMEATFATYWKKARPVTKWSNALLVPPPDGAIAVLMAADQNPAIANHIFRGMNDADLFEPWFYDTEQANRFLHAMT